ncbi:MAG TPA: glycosyltransferase [Solirubrobacteraceae bacterium]|nr:glycosyltransferase [Solirubrobacteraceae bacterium]
MERDGQSETISGVGGPTHAAGLTELRRRFPRVAVVHDWLTIPGGSERVVLELLAMFPDAELFTSVFDPDPWPVEMVDRPVHASFLNRLPNARRIYPKLLPLMSRAFESFDLSGFDLVLSSSHACAKNVLVPDGVPHVCYCHTPMRYAWDPAFLADEQVGRLTRLLLPALLGRLRRRDLAGAGRPTAFAANSSYVAERIERHYGRGARVIHPPVDIDRFLAIERSPRDYYLVLGRVVPYKRVDLAVAACARLGRPVKIAGDGRALEGARAAAGPDAEFLGRVPDAELPSLLGGARALLFCAEEDFGIVPVEAQAAGLPVIAYGVGGVRDSVLDSSTGVLFDAQTTESVCDAIRRFERIELDEATLRDNARRFDPPRFQRELADLIACASS